MSDLAIIIVAYALLIIGAFLVGAATTELGMRWRKNRARTIAASRISFDDAFPIIDEWAKQPGNEWYWGCREARRFAEAEFGRLTRDEPGLTVEMGLARVLSAVKARYPAAFQTLH